MIINNSNNNSKNDNKEEDLLIYSKAKTGDNTNIVPYILLSLISLIIIFAIIIKIKRNDKEENK